MPDIGQYCPSLAGISRPWSTSGELRPARPPVDPWLLLAIIGRYCQYRPKLTDIGQYRPTLADIGRGDTSVPTLADELFLGRPIQLAHIDIDIGRCAYPGRLHPARAHRYRHRPMCCLFLGRSYMLAHIGTNISRCVIPGEMDLAGTHRYRHQPMSLSWKFRSCWNTSVPTSADVLSLTRPSQLAHIGTDIGRCANPGEMDPTGTHRYRHRPMCDLDGGTG